MAQLLALAQQAGDRLLQRGSRIAAAESCTGGLLLSYLTDCPGSSAYVQGGIVSYSNEAKMRLLHVQAETLAQHGAVSCETAAQMAQGTQALFAVDYALSVTGIAGPGGGTAEKPVGLTYIGLAAPGGRVQVQRHIWTGDRASNKRDSVAAALQLLLAALRA